MELRKGDVRAAEGCQAIDAGKVQEYLVRAFDGHLGEAELAFAVRNPPPQDTHLTKTHSFTLLR